MIFDLVVWLLMMRIFALACVCATVKRAFHSWPHAVPLGADVYDVDVDADAVCLPAMTIDWSLSWSIELVVAVVF